MLQCRINFVQKKEIIQKYKDGTSAARLAEEYGCQVTTVYRFLREANVPRDHIKAIPFDSDLADKLRKEYESGETTTTLAKRYHTTKARVSRYIREAGGQIRPRGPIPRT